MSEVAVHCPRKLIGVVPPAAVHARRRLLGALAQAFPVEFEPREPGDLAGLDGAVAIASQQWRPLPSDQEWQQCPTLIVLPSQVAAGGGVVELEDDVEIARPLRGRQLVEERAPARVHGPQAGDHVLATLDGRPVWWRTSSSRWMQLSAYCPAELGEHEALREQLRVGRFMGLLPLVSLLRHVCQELEGDSQPLGAAFVVDDPNLHRASYGHLDYAELAGRAQRAGYHVGLATVPLDGWFASAKAVALVRANPGAISLLMHGNDHIAGELGRLTDERAAQRALAQALRRIDALQRRTGVVVERVMAPPHELCSAIALAAMFRLGFEGACIARPHPWREQRASSSFCDSPLLKWHPTDLVEGGLPILPRCHIERPREELVFRALLRQPLIVLAHHWDFADGLDLLDEIAGYIEGLAEVRWGSIGSIASRSFVARGSGQDLVLRMYSRRIRLEVPAGVRQVQVMTPCLSEEEAPRRLRLRTSGHATSTDLRHHHGWAGASLGVSPGAEVEIALVPRRPLDAGSFARPPLRPWPIARRALVEGRDRVSPLFARPRAR